MTSAITDGQKNHEPCDGSEPVMGRNKTGCSVVRAISLISISQPLLQNVWPNSRRVSGTLEGAESREGAECLEGAEIYAISWFVAR